MKKFVHYSGKPSIGHPFETNSVLSNTILNQILSDETLKPALTQFPFRVSQHLANTLDWHDKTDPLVRQFLPDNQELENVPGYDTDPLDESSFQVADKLLHKFHGRALLLVNTNCPVHCRFCFRRHNANLLSKETGLERFDHAFDYLQKHTDIQELILSGGDPFMLPETTLIRLIEKTERIQHIKRIRIHSRVPILAPELISDLLLKRLAQSRLSPWIVLHVNHADELTSTARLTIKRLILNGIPLLSQSVLLNKINDSLSALLELFNTLIDLGIKPYYLHLLDPVHGSAHFHVDKQKGQQLIGQLAKQLPGYAVPLLAQDIPGKQSKTVYCAIE
ncbi:MAG: KamA family radical SAM protein [Magnetococcales bacterium]|nr:KamA family radical SAM protein [Magnetococcales bacterium]